MSGPVQLEQSKKIYVFYYDKNMLSRIVYLDFGRILARDNFQHKIQDAINILIDIIGINVLDPL